MPFGAIRFGVIPLLTTGISALSAKDCPSDGLSGSDTRHASDHYGSRCVVLSVEGRMLTGRSADTFSMISADDDAEPERRESYSRVRM